MALKSYSGDGGIWHFQLRLSARAPFHPARFYEFVGSSWQGVVRAKGFFWLATRPAHVGELSQVGPVVRTSPLGFWWDAVARQDWPQSPESLASLRARLHRAYGDRRQQIVFIGIDIDKSDLCRRLHDCLIGSDDDEAVDFEALSLLPDPFPRGPRPAATSTSLLPGRIETSRQWRTLFGIEIGHENIRVGTLQFIRRGWRQRLGRGSGNAFRDD